MTVVVPVYRVRETLGRCVESIVGQCYDRLEVILVDDGSPDDCPQLCDEWAARDARIKVIHKPNGGLSDARNAGIDAAEGDYITFVDSDDFLATDTYSQQMGIMAAHPEYDILEFSVYRFFGSARASVLRFDNQVYRDMDEYWVAGMGYDHAYACNKIYRREVFCGVRFPVGKVFEDVYTLPLLLKNARTVATTPLGMYYYCYNKNGITVTACGAECRMLLDAHISIMDRYANHPQFYIYYMHVLDIQINEYVLTGDEPRLWGMRIYSRKGLRWQQKLKAIAVNILKVKRLCKLFKTIDKMAKRR